MTKKHAHSLLTHAAIDTTIRTLVALDFLQGIFYKDVIFPEIVKQAKITDSEEWELASGALGSFVFQCPSGNNQGVRMNSSAFINGLRMLDMEEEASLSLEVCRQTLHEDES